MVPTSSTKESECFVHERIDEEDKPKIRSNVCFDSANYEYEGDYYCLLHYPNNKKINDFTKAFYKRLGLEKYDFRGVWFPTKLKFPAKIYKSKVNFRYATFASKAKFKDTIFEAEADFLKATFLADANFDRTRFCKKVDFYKTIFRAGAYFEDAVFVGEAHFCTTTFSAEASFEKSTFLSKANFDSAKFLESSEIFFKDTKFREKVDFHYAVFAGYVLFEGDKDNQVFLKNSFMDLRDARLNNPERINFHRVGLRPNWFINTDCRKFIFTDIEEFTKINIKSELESLNTRGIKNSKQLFKIACRQLAENAENNNRFEEASNFRRMAFECENLEKKAEIAENKKNLQIIGNEFDISKSFDEIVIKSEQIKRLFGNTNDRLDLAAPLKITLNLIYPFSLNTVHYLHNFFNALYHHIFHFDYIHFLYRWTSSYGESWSRAAFVLAIIIFAFFPIIYTQTEFQVSPKNIPLDVAVKDCNNVVDELKPVCKIEFRSLNFWNGEAISHSLSTATFQTVEYRIPQNFWSGFCVILEKILAPLQAALLALAIRRKFMR